ncbi:hypothetical protein [Ornithinimicrobium sp. INDO-MA30-4]|uniref:hypothetical protein n=1 Tax=Ornithinimicrobium sp. INDO-MA30-4 TaxID=2908651 RepID=UPI001F3E4528|nr:hypothetical protein [Ornithinimicrobium sp. INDO-MA30-4]UJH69562.1 hypothetical protein L0A91_09295 [Ornithinimicrobium sp. INDO-MA30-4]
MVATRGEAVGGSPQRHDGDDLAVPGVEALVLSATGDVVSLREFVSGASTYPLLAGLRPDLYRCFMSQVWAHASAQGVSGLIHPETHLTDERAGLLRAQTYRQLARHWQFINELVLFEIDHHVSYGVHVYGYAGHDEVAFDNAAGLFHPDTVTRSRVHDGSGEQPGFKHEGKWDLRPHQSRIQSVTDETLAVWADVLEDDNPAQTRMVYTVNEAALRTLETLSAAPRVGKLGLDFSAGWNEKTDRQAGRFKGSWGPAVWQDAILQGPHLHVSTPFYKSPNATMKHNQDWSAVDLERLAPDTMPVTAYKPTGDPVAYNAKYTHWGPDRSSSARDHYRVAWRAMAANTGERTLISAVIPPTSAHLYTLYCVGGGDADLRTLMSVAASATSLLHDFQVRAAPKSAILKGVFASLPMVSLDHPLINSLLLRALRLNCLTDAYADLWAQCWDDAFLDDAPILTQHDPGQIGPEWTAQTPLRRAVDRRNALVENDALVALMLDVPIDDLVTIYRTQFAVLHGYDQRDYTYDINGRLVPNSVLAVWRKKGDAISVDERTATHTEGHDYVYELPFSTLDREADLRTAYAEFERRLADS